MKMGIKLVALAFVFLGGCSSASEGEGEEVASPSTNQQKGPDKDVVIEIDYDGHGWVEPHDYGLAESPSWKLAQSGIGKGNCGFRGDSYAVEYFLPDAYDNSSQLRLDAESEDAKCFLRDYSVLTAAVEEDSWRENDLVVICPDRVIVDDCGGEELLNRVLLWEVAK
jgi:hypothetical protein